MKNFLDLLATDHKIFLEIRLVPVGTPDIIVTINKNVLHKELLLAPKEFFFTVNLHEPLEISVQLMNKDYNSSNEQAVIVEKFKVDNFDFIERQWTNFIRYKNDHNSDISTNYLGWNGEWKFTTGNLSFYNWLHQATGQGWLLEP